MRPIASGQKKTNSRNIMRVRKTFMLVAVLACLVSAVEATEPPSSARSRSVISRIKPSLQKALRDKGLCFGAPIFLRIFKESKELELWVEKDGRFQLFRIYDICTFSGGLGAKIRAGDLQSPEGFYFVTAKHMNPNSRFHLSFDLGYPNAYDRYHRRTGSALMIHGDCVSIGCYAMTDAGIEEIYTLADAALRGGQSFFRVHIFPFRMTARNMKRHGNSRWQEFWQNLKEGYDFFERAGRPPNVEGRRGRYVLEES